MPKSPDPLAGLSPRVWQIISLVGRRADDAELLAFFAKLGAKVPATKGDFSGGKNVSAKKHGLEFVFDHDVKNDLYPLVPKTKSIFIPYLSHVWLTDKFPEPRPFGYEARLAPDEMTKRLGVTPGERGSGKYRQPYWLRVLDASRAILLSVDAGECTITIDEARELFGRYGMPARAVAGLFVAWAAQRNLLDATRVGSHAALLEDVRTGKRKGSEFLTTAWPRGLWDRHLVDKPGLRDFAFGWFHNIQVGFINDDLIAVFGGRKNAHSHDEPVLDDDAKAVKKATRKLDAVFAPWLK